MKTFPMRSIDAETAHTAMAAAIARAVELNLRMSVAICDASGVLKGFLRMDGASLLSVQIAQDKAYTAAASSSPTHAWYDRIKDDGPLLHGIVHTPRLVVFGGGYPIRDNGQVVGAIGLSGGHYTQDMDCAQAALAVIGCAAE